MCVSSARTLCESGLDEGAPLEKAVVCFFFLFEEKNCGLGGAVCARARPHSASFSRPHEESCEDYAMADVASSMREAASSAVTAPEELGAWWC